VCCVCVLCAYVCVLLLLLILVFISLTNNNAEIINRYVRICVRQSVLTLLTLFAQLCHTNIILALVHIAKHCFTYLEVRKYRRTCLCHQHIRWFDVLV